jgi:hypothetical protein
MKTRSYILLIFVVLTLMRSATVCFAQHSVSGTVTGTDGETLCGVAVYESGAETCIIADTCGRFQIRTQRSGCLLNFELVGYQQQTVEITRDTVIHIVMVKVLCAIDKGLTYIFAGITFDAVHAAPGLTLSNGYDEFRIIHFEDFSDRVVYKSSVAADFRGGWSFGANAGYRHPVRWLSSVDAWYRQCNYPSNDFAFRDIHVSASRWLKMKNTLAKLQAGHQVLNGAHNWGAAAGFEHVFGYYGSVRCMAGASAGYYTDWGAYSVYFQGFVFRDRFIFRAAYDRISRYNILNVGISYCLIP